ncbi:hypothetical protein ACRAWF_17080 [Streptomyces sp. L7]
MCGASLLGWGGERTLGLLGRPGPRFGVDGLVLKLPDGLVVSTGADKRSSES